MARLLTSLGIPCGHEAVFNWGGYSLAEMRLNRCVPLRCSDASSMSLVDGNWIMEPVWVNVDDIVAESSYLAATFLSKPLLEGATIIHVSRNPINVINSFCNYLSYFELEQPRNLYERFIYEQFPVLTRVMPQYDRAALYYILWNELIEPFAGYFHRIEDGADMMLEFLGRHGEYYENDRINSLQKPGRRFRVGHIQSVDIRQRLEAKCDQYGYEVKNGTI